MRVNSILCLWTVLWMVAPAVAGPPADTDGDGVDDAADVCDNTPADVLVDAEGRPRGDLDGDCDADLEDASLFQLGFTGPLACLEEDADKDGVCNELDNCPKQSNPDQANADGDAVGDVCDGCPNDRFKVVPGVCGCGVGDVDSDDDGSLDCQDECDFNPLLTIGPCPDIELQLVLRKDPSGLLTTQDVPESLDEMLAESCGVLEIYARDVSNSQAGIICLFIDVHNGDKDCSLGVNGIHVADATFPVFQSGSVEGPTTVSEVGGCGFVPQIGVDAWVLVATLDVVAPLGSCTATLSLENAEVISTLFGDNTPAVLGLGSNKDVEVRCGGTIYDLDGDGQVNAGDLSMFQACLGQPPFTPGCIGLDYNCDSFINQADQDLFGTAFQQQVCAGGIEVDACQLNCDAP